MKKLYTLICSIIVSSSAFGQSYHNKVYYMPEEFLGFITVNGYFLNDEIVVSLFHFSPISGTRTSLAIIDNDDNVITHTYPSINCGLDCLLFDNTEFYIHGNSNYEDFHAALIKLKPNFQKEWTETYPLSGNLTSNLEAFIDQSHIYAFSLSELDDDPLIRKTNLRKITKEGEVVWSKSFGQDYDINYPWDIEVDSSGNIYLGTRVVKPIASGWGELKKLEKNGDLVWEILLPYEFPDGSVPILLTELSNGNIAAYSERELFAQPQFWDQPPVIHIIDPDGNILFDTTLITSTEEELSFLEIKSGREEYFFTFGSEFNFIDDVFWGTLYKFTNEGTLVWKKRYRHPDYISDLSLHEIKDIVELENGDIITIGEILKLSEGRNVVWIMKLNSEGCLVDSNCSEDVVTSVQESNSTYFKNKLSIFPNPVDNQLLIDWKSEEKYALIELRDLGGKIYMKSNNEIATLNTSDLQAGMYLIRVIDPKGLAHIRKFIKY